MFDNIRVRISLVVLVVGLLTFGLFLSQHNSPAANEAIANKPKANIADNYGKLPLSFIENQGQIDSRVSQYIQSPGQNIYFTRNGHTLSLSKGKGADATLHNIKVELIDAATESVEGLQRSPGIVSYFNGDKENWKTGIPTNSKIGYVQPWPGIDLTYDGTTGKLESIYTVAPNADPSQIKLRYSGQYSLRLDDDGSLIYSTSLGDIKETAPVAWQDINGQRLPVETSFTLLDKDTVAFNVSVYDTGKELIIDPTFVYASFFGGSGDDRGLAIAVDTSGNAYVAGYTNSTDLPVTVGPDSTYNFGSHDAYVAKLNSSGTALIYAGYIGGSGYDDATGIAVDSSGNAYITGNTNSSEASFPVTVGPDTSYNGNGDVYVAKLNSSGTTLTYAGYIGGNKPDGGSYQNIAVDGSGNAYISGTTLSSEAMGFPVTVGPDTSFNSTTICTTDCTGDAFVAKVNATGSALIYAGYIGGAYNDEAGGIAVDSSGNAYVTGQTVSTESTGFPVTTGPDLTQNGGSDAFVAKVNSTGSSLIYCGFVGGASRDDGFGIAIDRFGSAYITGRTGSSGASFPNGGGFGTLPSFNPTHYPDGSAVFDAFVVKVNASGTGLVYAGYIGGSGTEYGRNIAVDSEGSSYVNGQTPSTENDFPVILGPDLTQNGGIDAFVVKINPSGTGVVYSGFIGGSGSDIGYGIAIDSSGNAYAVGSTNSSESSFPNGNGFGSVPGYDQTQNGSGDAFIVKISPQSAFVTVSGRVTTPTGAGLRNAMVFITDSLGNTRTATTSSFGFYQFDNVEAGGTYTVGVTSRLYRFQNQIITPHNNLSNLDFMGLE